MHRLAQRLLGVLALGDVLQRADQAHGAATPVLGLAKGKVVVPDDFDAPLDDFKEYM